MAAKDHRNEGADARNLDRRGVLLGGTTLVVATRDYDRKTSPECPYVSPP